MNNETAVASMTTNVFTEAILPMISIICSPILKVVLPPDADAPKWLSWHSAALWQLPEVSWERGIFDPLGKAPNPTMCFSSLHWLFTTLSPQFLPSSHRFLPPQKNLSSAPKLSLPPSYLTLDGIWLVLAWLMTQHRMSQVCHMACLQTQYWCSSESCP